MAYKILNGDVREMLRQIEGESIQCVITSPPYWGLRNYGVDGQLGLEDTPEDYISNMVEVFREIHRVLRPDGVVWLNLGDSYIGGGRGGLSGCGGGSLEEKRYKMGQRIGKPTGRVDGYKPKDLVGIPWATAFALRDDGWYLRSGIPWLKGSAMPESVTDRPATALEYFFLFSKSRKYYYDHHAVKVEGAIPAGTKAAKGSKERASQDGVNARPPEYKVYDGKRNRRNTDWFMDSIRGILDRESGTLLHDHEGSPIAIFCNPQPYKGAHFAVFSPRLILPMMLAGTSPRACEVCGTPLRRIVCRVKENKVMRDGEWEQEAAFKGIIGTEGRGGRARVGLDRKSAEEKNPGYETIGWSRTCECESGGFGKCVVLDPFAGVGTTLGVAESLGLDSVGIELSDKYCNLIPERVAELRG